MVYSYGGNILRVNLTTNEVKKESMTRELAATWLGGAGVNSKILYEEVKPEVDPLGPENRLLFGSGPLSGLTPWGSKTTFTFKSPLTGIFGDTTVGGFFGEELRYAGYDNVVISGAAKKPVYLWISDDIIEIRDASHLWGKDTWETQDIIRKDAGDPEVKVAAIGPAGENMALWASIVVNKIRGAGRVGGGAVAGSKKLKAVAVRGTKPIVIAHPDEFMETLPACEKVIMTHPTFEIFGKYGPNLCTEMYNDLACLAVRNWQRTNLDPELAAKSSMKAQDRCYIRDLSCSTGCIQHCDQYFNVTYGKYTGSRGENTKLVYIMAFFVADIHDEPIEFTCYAGNVGNQLGLDMNDIGPVVGACMELWEKGIITEKDTEGIRYDWGNADAVIETMRRAAYRKGKWGNLLADGIKGLRTIKGAEDYIVHVKGAGYVTEDTRTTPSWALGFAVAHRGADHLSHFGVNKWAPEPIMLVDLTDGFIDKKHAIGWMDPDPEGNGVVIAFSEHLCEVVDSFSICKFPAVLLMTGKPSLLAKLYTYATGIPMTMQELIKAGERIWNIEKAFNVKLGLSRKDDRLPKRIMTEGATGGPGKGMKCEDYFEPMLTAYYKAHGWDPETSWPTRSKLEELGLKYVADDLEKIGKLGKEKEVVKKKEVEKKE